MPEGADITDALGRLRGAGLDARYDGSWRIRMYRLPGSAGNHRPGYSVKLFGLDPAGGLDAIAVLDAPIGWLLRHPSGAWMFSVADWTPGPGPGDFTREHGSLAEAVADALDYYFGDSLRMCDEWTKARRTRRCT